MSCWTHSVCGILFWCLYWLVYLLSSPSPNCKNPLRMKVWLKVRFIGSAPMWGSLVQHGHTAREVAPGDYELGLFILRSKQEVRWDLAGEITFLYKVIWMLIGSLGPGRTHTSLPVQAETSGYCSPLARISQSILPPASLLQASLPPPGWALQNRKRTRNEGFLLGLT